MNIASENLRNWRKNGKRIFSVLTYPPKSGHTGIDRKALVCFLVLVVIRNANTNHSRLQRNPDMLSKIVIIVI